MTTVEQIRIKSGLTQAQFAKTIGLSLRSYQHRIEGTQDWKLRELVEISEKYQSKFEVECGNKYTISIKKD